MRGGLSAVWSVVNQNKIKLGGLSAVWSVVRIKLNWVVSQQCGLLPIKIK